MGKRSGGAALRRQMMQEAAMANLITRHPLPPPVLEDLDAAEQWREMAAQQVAELEALVACGAGTEERYQLRVRTAQLARVARAIRRLRREKDQGKYNRKLLHAFLGKASRHARAMRFTPVDFEVLHELADEFAEAAK